MSNRFHNKYHRHNHHTDPTGGPLYPDSSYDPIASPDSPFRGEFRSEGKIATTNSLSAQQNVYAADGNFYGNVNVSSLLNVSGDGQFFSNVDIDGNLNIDQALNVVRASTFQDSVTIFGNLSVEGTTTQLDTQVYVTSALSITNTGTGPALVVTQTGSQPVAQFFDEVGHTALYVEGVAAKPGWVGIGNSSPNVALTVSGSISALSAMYVCQNATIGGSASVYGILSSSAVVYASGGNSDQWNSNFNTTYSLSGGWESAYSTLTATSATWVSNFNTTSTLSGRWAATLPLSGGSLTGDVTTTGSVSATTLAVSGVRIYPPAFAIQAADQILTSTTVLSSSTNLTFPLAPSATYNVTSNLLLSTAGPGIDLVFVVPVGTTTYGKWFVSGDTSSTPYDYTTRTNVMGNGVGGVRQSIDTFLVSTNVTAGNLTLQFSQNALSAVGVALKKDSWIRLDRLA